MKALHLALAWIFHPWSGKLQWQNSLEFWFKTKRCGGKPESFGADKMRIVFDFFFLTGPVPSPALTGKLRHSGRWGQVNAMMNNSTPCQTSVEKYSRAQDPKLHKLKIWEHGTSSETTREVVFPKNLCCLLICGRQVFYHWIPSAAPESGNRNQAHCHSGLNSESIQPWWNGWPYARGLEPPMYQARSVQNRKGMCQTDTCESIWA